MITTKSIICTFCFQFQDLDSFDGKRDCSGSLASTHDPAVIQFFPVSGEFEDYTSLFHFPVSFSRTDILFAAVCLVVKEHRPVSQGNLDKMAVLVINRLIIDTDLACEKG